MVIGVYSWSLANFVLCGSLLAGLLFESQRAGLIAIAAFVAMLSMHFLLAVVEYRRTMRRAWPKVAPLPDDDDD
jgi:hypothetical protein